MKKLVFLMILCITGTTEAQVVELSELNVLYREYENIIEIPNQDSLEFSCTGCVFARDEFTITVTPDKNVRTVNLILKKNGDTVHTCAYRVSNLPEPIIYWGGIKNNINPFSKVLQVNTESRLPSNYSYEIGNWQLICDGNELQGNGTLLSNEAMYFLRGLPPNKKVTLTVNVTTSTDKVFTLSNTYTTEECSSFWRNSVDFDGDIIIIDKNENNQSLFDTNDPFSLLGLIRNNEIRSINFMSEVTADRLKKSGAALLSESGRNLTCRASDYPTVYDDPKSPDFGEPVIEVLTDGTMEYVYPNVSAYHYDLDDISRIIVFYDSVQNEVTGEKYYGIDRLGFAKKYAHGNKFEIVFTADFKELAKMDGYKVLVKLDETDKAELLETNEFFVNLKSSASVMLPNYLELQYEPTYYYDELSDFYLKLRFNRFDRYWHSRIPSREERQWNAHHPIEPSPEAFSHIDNELPFDFISANEARAIFDCQVKDIPKDLVLTNEFGDPLTRTLENGQEEEIMMIDSNIVWINFKPNSVYVLFDLNYNLKWNAGYNTILAERIFFTSDSLQKQKEICLVHYGLDENEQRQELTRFLDGHGIYSKLPNFQDYENLPWRITLNEEITQGKKLSVTNKKDRKQILHEFNLDSVSGLPTNLLGIVK